MTKMFFPESKRIAKSLYDLVRVPVKKAHRDSRTDAINQALIEAEQRGLYKALMAIESLPMPGFPHDGMGLKMKFSNAIKNEFRKLRT